MIQWGWNVIIKAKKHLKQEWGDLLKNQLLLFIRLCEREICSWSFFPSSLAVLTDNFGLNCFYRRKEPAILAIINPFLQEKMVPNVCLASLPSGFARMTVCRLGWWPSHCYLSPAPRTGHIQIAAGRAANSVFGGHVASSPPANPALCAAPTWCG